MTTDNEIQILAWVQAGTAMAERRVGIEGWFDEPEESMVLDHPPGPARRAIPPRWKQATTIWSAFFPMSLLFAVLVGRTWRAGACWSGRWPPRW